MASSTYSCGFCSLLFNSSDHKPLFLDCCHTLCVLCVIGSKSSAGIRCYRCQKITTKSVAQLPINFDLIPTTSDNGGRASQFLPADLCRSHAANLEYLCADCEDLICKQCHKNDHLGHKVDSIKNIAGTGSAADAWKEVHNKLTAKSRQFTKILEKPSEMLKLVAELNADLEEWQNFLLRSSESVENDLNAWNALATRSSDQAVVKNIVQRLKKVEVPKCEKLPQIKAKVDALKKKSAELQDELLPHLEDWRVEGQAGCASALVSVEAGRYPRKVTIYSWPSDPIQQMPKLLDTCAGVCTGDIQLYLMEFFWSRAPKSNEHLSAAIQKHGQKMEAFCGYPLDAIAVCRARGQSSLHIGVRIATVSDVKFCAPLSLKPYYVSCIRGLPHKAGEHMRKQGWSPTVWSFPRVSDVMLDWIFAMTKPFVGDEHPCDRTLCLPGCRLTDEGMRKLIVNYADCARYFALVECETSSIAAPNRSSLETFAERQRITIKWSKFGKKSISTRWPNN